VCRDSPRLAIIGVVGEHHDPIWVRVATTQPVVKAGLVAMLQTAPLPLAVTTAQPVLADRDFAEPDVVLFDVILMQEGDTADLDTWVKDTATTVIAIDRTLRPDLGAQARTRGVEWSITLEITADELHQVVCQAVAGRLEDSHVLHEWEPADFIGQDVGLSRRESEVLGLVVQGLSNNDIAAALFLSINSVKTYIRSTYRKIGVSTRSQAVAAGMEHGFSTEAPCGSTDAWRGEWDRRAAVLRWPGPRSVEVRRGSLGARTQTRRDHPESAHTVAEPPAQSAS
jgi:DNA-binding NarL/FixJ family response regulator